MSVLHDWHSNYCNTKHYSTLICCRMFKKLMHPCSTAWLPLNGCRNRHIGFRNCKKQSGLQTFPVFIKAENIKILFIQTFILLLILESFYISLHLCSIPTDLVATLNAIIKSQQIYRTECWSNDHLLFLFWLYHSTHLVNKAHLALSHFISQGI